MFNPSKLIALGLDKSIPIAAHDVPERCQLCGTIAETVLPNGKLSVLRRVCGEYRYCKMCNARRAEEYRMRLIKHARATGQPLQEFTIPKGQTSYTVTNGMGRANYLKLPQEDGSQRVIASLEAKLPTGYAATPLTEEDLYQLPWDRLVTTPEGMRITGDLGKPKREPLPQEIENVRFAHAPFLETNAPPEQREACYLKAVVADSAHAAPTDLLELEKAMQRRMAAYALELLKAGFHADVTTGQQWYRINRSSINIAWLRVIPGEEKTPKDTIEDYGLWFWMTRGDYAKRYGPNHAPGVQVDGD